MASKEPLSKYRDASDSESLLSVTEKQFRDSSDSGESSRPRIIDDGSAREPQEPRSKAARATRALRNNWYIVDFTGFAIIIILLAGLYERQPQEVQIGGDISRFAPRFAQEIVMFRPEEKFFPEDPEEWFNNPKVKDAWLDIVPPGLDYIEMADPSTYSSLPSSPLQDPHYANRTVYTTSMTHQLHCLHAVVNVHYSLTSDPPRQPPEEMSWHLRHCFDYLRQSIMCAGDVTLEGAQTTFPPGWGGSDGWDARHVCKRYPDVKEYLTERRADDKLWI